MRGPSVTQEYYNAPDATEQAVTDDGWFKTGDIVRVSPERYVDVVDRMDDLVKSGGEWSPRRGRRRGYGSRRGRRSRRCPCPPRTVGRTPRRVRRHTRCVSDEAALRQEIKDLVAESYPSWWVPDAIRLVDGIPKGATGKFSKQTLRDEYVDESVIETVAENAPATYSALPWQSLLAVRYRFDGGVLDTVQPPPLSQPQQVCPWIGIYDSP